MAVQMQKAISGCEQCIQHEGTHAKVPMQPIIVTAPFKLLHMDFTSIEMTKEVSECFGLLQPLYKTCYGLCDP